MEKFAARFGNITTQEQVCTLSLSLLLSLFLSVSVYHLSFFEVRFRYFIHEYDLTLSLSHCLCRSLNHEKVKAISFSPRYTIPNATHALYLSFYAVLCLLLGLSSLSYFHSQMYSIILPRTPIHLPPPSLPLPLLFPLSTHPTPTPIPYPSLPQSPPSLILFPLLSLLHSSLPPSIRLKDFRSALHLISYGVLKRT